MSARGIMMAAAAAGLLAAMGGAAHAEGARVLLVSNDFSGPAPESAPATPRRTLEWDSRKGRWGLKLGVEQHVDRDVELKDVQPGLY
ncbi:MAG: hypothetical protein JOZ27_07750, partial [Caulobacteraceae bacterium]|nr:hypothetical protein [Caulobacteraceae bacterium]